MPLQLDPILPRTHVVSRPLLRLFEEIGLVEARVTDAERRTRLQALGFVLCTCTGLDRGDRYVMIHDPNCPIHHLERRRG